jgi:DNA-binding transcriptional ArsR family regulator
LPSTLVRPRSQELLKCATSRSGKVRMGSTPKGWCADVNKPLYQAKADFFKTLSHPVRIRLLEVLADGELSVADLLGRVRAPAAGLSQQLAVLRQAGLIQARRDSGWVSYTLTDPRIADLLAVARDILGAVRAEQVELLADLRMPLLPTVRQP